MLHLQYANHYNTIYMYNNKATAKMKLDHTHLEDVRSESQRHERKIAAI